MMTTEQKILIWLLVRFLLVNNQPRGQTLKINDEQKLTSGVFATVLKFPVN